MERNFLSKNVALRVALAVGTLCASAALAKGNVRDQLIFAGVLDGHEHLSAQFHVNRDLGRAWVDVQLVADSADGVPVSEVTQNMARMVDGLYYDRSTKQVVYQRGKVRTVCAQDSSFLWDTAVKPTGQCPLQVSTQTETVDDGFTTHPAIMGKVIIQLPMAAPSSVSNR